jgi:hypothetical protein
MEGAACFLHGLAAGQPRRHVSWRGWAAPGAGRLGPVPGAAQPCRRAHAGAAPLRGAPFGAGLTRGEASPDCPAGAAAGWSHGTRRGSTCRVLFRLGAACDVTPKKVCGTTGYAGDGEAHKHRSNHFNHGQLLWGWRYRDIAQQGERYHLGDAADCERGESAPRQGDR